MSWTSRVREIINSGLAVAGLQVNTTRAQRVEADRIDSLVLQGHWSEPYFVEAMNFEPGRFRAFLQEVCIPYRNDYTKLPGVAAVSDGFFVRNGWFQAVDAEVLYSVLRHFQPRLVIEVGSGFSTKLMRRAITDGNLPTRIRSIDPDPRVDISRCADEHLKCPVEHSDPVALADCLQPGDILFIDSSHMVQAGGDVPYLFLKIIPRLRPGVLIHIHDIYLPFEYPLEWVSVPCWNWSEQYLVQAFLYRNAEFETLWAGHYMWRMHREDVVRIIPCNGEAGLPSSLWLKKVTSAGWRTC